MFWIDLFDPSDNAVGPGPLTSGVKWRYTHRLSRSGEWSLEVPATDPRLAFAALKAKVKCYAMMAGQKTLMGGGTIEKRVMHMSGGGAPTMVLSGNDVLYELARLTLRLEVDYNSPFLGVGLYDKIMEGAPDWQIATSGYVPNFTARFVDESILNALTTVTNKTGQMFRLEPLPLSISGIIPKFLRIFSAVESTGIVATNLAEPVAVERNINACLITEIERQEDAFNLINRLSPYGSGTGSSRLTTAAATLWPDGSASSGPYTINDVLGRAHTFTVDQIHNVVTDTGSYATYGNYAGQAQWKEIAPITNSDPDMAAAANVLLGSAVQFLLNASIPQEHYTIGVAGLRKQVFPGQSIRVVARQMRDGQIPININQDLIIQEVVTELDATGLRTVGLTVSTTREFAQTDAQVLVAQIQNQLSYQAHPQMGPTDPVICYREDIDGDHGATFPFWISNATTQVNSVIARFKLEKLRSTVKSVGGTATGSVTIPTHNHNVTISSHTHSVSVPSHSHDIPLDGDAASHGLARLVYFNPPDSHLYYDASGGPAVGVTSNSGGSSTPTSASSGGQTVASGGGGSGTVAIDLANAISAVYGIFEDPNAAYGVGDLRWALNSEIITTTPTAIGFDWYELDITNLVINTLTARPLQAANTLSVSVAPSAVVATRNVRITAQIEIRKIIQSIAATPSAVASTASASASPFTGTTSTATVDADTLDGYDSTSFVKVTDYDPADILAKIVTVDGSGSGLDADTLDGLDSTAFALSSHTQAASTITDFTEAAQDVVGAMFTDSATIDFTYDDTAGTETAIVIDSSITFAKMQTLATDRLIGRDTAGTGAPESIALGASLEFGGSGTIQRAALTGDVTASANSNATTIANDAVTFAKFQNIATDSLVGRDTASTGDPESITLGASLEFSGTGTIQRAALTGDVTASANSNATVIANDAVTFAKMQNVVTDSLIGRDTTGTGDPESITLGASLEFGGSGTIQRAALTGDVTATANSNALTIATAAVTDAKLRNSGALSVIGRSANSTGAPADISATAASGAVLRESGSVLGFGTIATAGIAANAVTNAKLAQMTQATVKGRAAAAGTGDPVDLTAAQLITILTAADGAGSLLDADFLDGISSAAFPQLAVANTFTTVQTITPSSTGVNGLEINMPSSTAGTAIVGRYNAVDRLYLTLASGSTQWNMASADLGNNITGPAIFIGRNTNATNASAGSVGATRKDGSAIQYLWSDASGVWRTGTSAPTGTTDTSGGSVVGAQTSMAAAKNISDELPSLRVAFEHVLDAAQNGLRAWGYKSGAYNGEHFPNGLVVDYAPRYGMDRDAEHPHGKSLNVAVAIGDLMASIAVLNERLNKLEGK